MSNFAHNRVDRYPAVLLRRREDAQTALTSDPGFQMTEFEAFLVAQSYGGISMDRARGQQFTAVVYDGKITFMRRILDVEDISAVFGQAAVHFVTNGNVPSYLRALEGREYPRNLRRVKYVDICHNPETDEVWVEDANGRVC